VLRLICTQGTHGPARLDAEYDSEQLCHVHRHVHLSPVVEVDANLEDDQAAPGHFSWVSRKQD